MKDYARSLYESRRWKRTHNAYMISRNYVCERCGGLARIVHHKTYVSPQNINDVSVTLDWANLEALCMDCHAGEHGTKACVDGLRFDSSGNLVKK